MRLTASFLAHEGIALTADAEALLVAPVSDLLPMAYDVLERQGWGDYTPDKTPETFPAWLLRIAYGSSHKGGSYSNYRTGNSYCTHKQVSAASDSRVARRSATVSWIEKTP